QHEAVAAVVAATTGNHDPSRLRPAFAKYPPGGRTGALHQHIAVASEHGGGLLVDPAGGARVEQQGGGRRHGPILSPRQGRRWRAAPIIGACPPPCPQARPSPRRSISWPPP